MTQEEKLEEAKRLYETANADQKYVLERLFPELKESEDEKIRKALIILVKKAGEVYENVIYGVSIENAIAWLEKQGEHAKFINGIQVGDKVTRNEDGVLVNFSQLNRVAKKQGEQKPAWSEEDERMLDIILNDINYAQKNFSSSKLTPCVGKVDWLKFRRPQNNITDEELAQAKKNAYNDALDKIEYHSGEPTFDDGWSAAIWYLKKRNIMPRNTWKPSDEQITWLYRATDEAKNDSRMKQVLNGLLSDLKKLTD